MIQSLSCFCLFLLLLCGPAKDALALTGSYFLHDPSTIIKCKNKYWIYGTGPFCPSIYSTDKVQWFNGPNVFKNLPGWVKSAVPAKTDNDTWAPDVQFINNQYCLYYSVSTFGSNVSAIGLVTNPTLDPGDPTYKWTDKGVVVQSDSASNFNTIDPSILRDYQNNLWLSYGSYWSGIKLVQLDANTGKPIPNTPTYSLATRSNWPFSIEASYLYKRGGYYYLFVNWDYCCRGVNSNYNIRVGRSKNITGPYFDKDGVDMLKGGGSLFLGTRKYLSGDAAISRDANPDGSGKGAGKPPTPLNQIGPGHVGILVEGAAEWLSNHYYDGNSGGRPTDNIERLTWDTAGWPVVEEHASAYPFTKDARDTTGGLNGTLVGGASIQTDTIRGAVLNLSGQGQYVSLPSDIAYSTELTFAAWVKWNGGPDWQRIFDFGVNTGVFIYLTPRNGVTKHAYFSINAGNGEQSLDAPAAFPMGVWTHVALSLSATAATLYLNGVQAAVNTNFTVQPFTLHAIHNYLGKSQFNDPYFNGRMSGVRVIARALGPQEIGSLAAETALSFDRQSGLFMDDSYDGAILTRTLTAQETDGLTGQAVQCDGVSAAFSTLHAVIDTSQSYSVAAWVKFDSLSGDQAILSQDGAKVSAFTLGKNSVGRLYFTLTAQDAATAAAITVMSSAAVVSGVWYHLTGLYDRAAGQMKLYVNGVLQQSAAFHSAWKASGSTVIGRALAGRPTLFLNGAVDDATAAQHTLSDFEIQRLFTRGAAAYLKFNELQGATANDATNDGFLGALTGGATWQANSGGACVRLNGTTACVDMNGAVVDTSQSFSVSAWVSLNALNGWQTFASQGGANVSAFFLQKRGDDNRFAFVAFNGDSIGAGSALAESAFAPAPNTWYHLAGVYDAQAAQIRLYVNGQLQGATDFTIGWSAGGPSEIGRALYAGIRTDFVNGLIDNARFYRRALSDAETTAIFHSGL